MNAGSGGNYFIRLDALRAFSVLAVLLHHFFHHSLGKYTFIGNAGVDVFFVISGFLITGILIRNKQSSASKAHSLKKFYIRRFFRIFPIYYLYLLMAALLFYPLCKESLPWALTYTINIFSQHHTEPVFFAHLWSLSIEEQFYIVWPFLVLFTPQKHLMKLIIAVIVLALAVKLLVPGINHKLFTISCMDAFGAGALLAFGNIYRPSAVDAIIRQRWLLYAALAAYLLLVAAAIMGYHQFEVLHRTIVSVIGFFLVAFCVNPAYVRSERWNRIFENPTLVFIGKISYGIYIYHFMIRYLLDPPLNDLLSEWFGNSGSALKYIYYNSYLLKFPLYTLISVAIALISFRFIETPILKVKERVAG